MKNSFKIGSLAMGIAVSVIACDPPHANTNKPSIDSPQKTTDTGNKAAMDTAKKDTTKKM
jgi:hypothetical protein